MAKVPSLPISSPRWHASAQRRTRDLNASVGLITSPGGVVLMEARSRPNESMHMKKSQIPVAILVRVSTAKQETARQISELRQYADGKDYEVLEVCEETISGSAEDDERHGLHRAAQLARDGHIKKVLVHEISRIARRNSVAHRSRCWPRLHATNPKPYASASNRVWRWRAKEAWCLAGEREQR
jgi:Resolvase, N terminal domain